MQYDGRMLRYHIALYLPRVAGEMVVAEALDFPGAVTQGFDLADARLMIASAMEDLARCLLEDGKPLLDPEPGCYYRRRLDRTRAADSPRRSPSLKRHELIGHLKDQGCRLDREGSRHTIYVILRRV